MNTSRRRQSQRLVSLGSDTSCRSPHLRRASGRSFHKASDFVEVLALEAGEVLDEFIAMMDGAFGISQDREWRVECSAYERARSSVSPRMIRICAPALTNSAFIRSNWAVCSRHCTQMYSRMKNRTTFLPR